MTPLQLREIIAAICKEEVEKQARFLLDRFDGVLRLMMKQYPESQRGLAQAQVIMQNYRVVFGEPPTDEAIRRIGAVAFKHKAPEEEVAQPKVRRPYKLSEEVLAKRREKLLAKVVQPKAPVIRVSKMELATRDYKAGDTDLQTLADRYELSKIYLESYFKRSGVIARSKPGRKANPQVMERNANIVAMRSQGGSPSSIAKILGISTTLVNQVLYQAKCRASNGAPAGANGVGSVVVPGSNSRPL